MSQAEISVIGSRFVDESDPSQTLDNCIAAVDFIGTAIDAIQHGAGEIDGEAVALFCMTVSDALHHAKARGEKIEQDLLEKLRKATGGAQ